jgi:hypothetical protein
MIIFNVLLFRKLRLLTDIFYTALVFLASISLLLINPQFWDTLSSNSRYSLTFVEIFSLPIGKWLYAFLANFQIGFYGITPLLFLVGLAGIVLIIFKKNNLKNQFLGFCLSSFAITTLLVRVPNDRYLVPFLPFLVIPAAYAVWSLIGKNKFIGKAFLVLIFIIPFCLTTLQVTEPVNYLILTQKLTYFTNESYLRGFTSGYGINEMSDYFKSSARDGKITVTIADNTGNPESALITYFNRSSNIQVVYMDLKILGTGVLSYDCMTSRVPLYFVARDEQLAGLDKYLEKIKTIKNPYGQNTIGIYVLKKNCKGKTFELKPVTA